VLGELPGIEQRPIRIPDRRVDERVLERGDALAVQRFQKRSDPVAAMLGTRRRDQLRDELLRVLFQHTARLALGTAIDGATLRIARGRGDPGEPQRVAVGDTVVTCGVLEPHRIVRCHGVQIGRQDIAVLGELALIPSLTQEPFTRLEPGNSRAHAPHHLGNAPGIAQLNVIHLTEAAIGHVCVRVDETGGRRAAVQIEDARLRTLEGEDRGVGAHGDNPAVADCNGLRNRVPAVGGDDRPMRQDEIGR
jgi:hypothetical protein